MPDRIQLNTYIKNDDFYSMQDFFNRTNLRDYTIMTREKYASMEKKYIDKTFNEVQINNKEFDNINNKGTDINLESKEKKQ